MEGPDGQSRGGQLGSIGFGDSEFTFTGTIFPGAEVGGAWKLVMIADEDAEWSHALSELQIFVEQCT